MDPSSDVAESLVQEHREQQKLIDEKASDEVEEVKAFLGPTMKNVIAGTLAGAAGVVVGHPFDTVKVRLQSQKIVSGSIPVYQGTWQTFGHIYKHESIAGFFKGMASPLVGVAVINAALFGVYGFLLDSQQKLAGNQHEAPALHQIFWAGAGSGFINSIISGPTELVKIQLQNQKEGRKSFTQHTLKGPLDCLQKIYRQDGLRGCFRGMAATILRETPSYGVYFATFEAIQRKLQRGQEISPLSLMMAGGLSGVFGWISTYPIDVIKTKIQAQPVGNVGGDQNYKGILDCGRSIVKAEGPTVLWRGLGATIVRAFPTNAVIFLTYSITMDLLEK